MTRTESGPPPRPLVILLELTPEHLDPYAVLWAICHRLETARLPRRRVVVRLDFPALPRRNRFWLLIERSRGEVCVKPPGFAEDLVVTADPEWFVKWHMGQVPWSEALRSGRITVEGPRDLVRAFPTWNALSPFAGVRPAHSG